MVTRKHAHPGRAIGLLEHHAIGQGRVAVEDTDVVQSQEAAFKDVIPLGVFAVDPPGEVEHQFLEDALQEDGIARPRALLLLL